MIVSNVLFYAATKALQQRIDSVDLGFQLDIETCTAPGLLSLKINTCPVVRGAPPAGWFCPVAFHFACLAKLAS
jgi:hypothetical protein